MAEPALRHATIEDAATFLEWAACQTGKYEFEGGAVRAMSGGTGAHSRLGVRLAAGLDAAAGDGPCQAHNDDFALRMPNGEVFRPDVLVACSGFGIYATTEPLLVAEVLSPSTESVWRARLPRLKALPSLRHALFVEATAMRVEHHRRASGGSWAAALLTEPEEAIRVPELGFALPLDGLYRGLLA